MILNYIKLMEEIMDSVNDNFLHMIQKIEYLEDLSARAHFFVTINYALENIPIKILLLDYPLASVLIHIDVYLKFISGHELNAIDMGRMYSPIFGLFGVGSNSKHEIKLIFDDVIDPYINSLDEFMHTHCAEMEFKGVIDHSASTNLSHIFCRINLMQKLYIKAYDLCPKVKYIDGYGSIDMVILEETDQDFDYVCLDSHTQVLRDIRCDELLNIIGLYLKLLNGRVLTNSEYDSYMTYTTAGVRLIYGLFPDQKKNTLLFDIEVEPYILWLQNIVNQCNNYNEVILIANNRFKETIMIC